MFIVAGVLTLKMEVIEAPPNKCQKTEFCDSDKTNGEDNRNILLLQGYHIQIMEAGIGKVRSELFRKKITELGGTLCPSISDNPDILIVDEKMTADRLYRLLNIDGPQQLESVTVVQTLWLSDCIKYKKRLRVQNYELELSTSCCAVLSANDLLKSQQPRSQQAATQDTPQCSYISSFRLNEDSDADSNYMASGEEDDAESDAEDVNCVATSLQRRPLPVCFFYSFLYILSYISLVNK